MSDYDLINGEILTVTVTVDEETVIANINTAARGPAGTGGGSSSITSATTSDGTADLDLLNVETVTATVTGTLTAPHIHGNLAGSVYAHIRAGENLAKGDPVYVSGSHGSGSTLIPIVSKADASNAAKMPAIGIMDEAVANNANGHMVIVGTITELNTTGLTVNAELYVDAGGGMTGTPPTARAQPVARVERVNANNGAVIVKVNGLSASDATANTLVRRDSSGGASFAGMTVSGSVTNSANNFFTAQQDFSDSATWLYTAASKSNHLSSLGAGTTGSELFGAATVAAAQATLGVTSKRKTVQTDRNNTGTGTTYTTDGDFTIPVEAGKTYRVEFAIYVTCTNNSQFKGQFVIPSFPPNFTTGVNGVGLLLNAAGSGQSMRLLGSGVVGDNAFSRTSAVSNGGFIGWFEVTIGTTGGNLLFQWAQNSSSVDNTSVLANSCVTVRERFF